MSIKAVCDRCGKTVEGINGGASPLCLHWRQDVFMYMDKGIPVDKGNAVRVLIPLPPRDSRTTLQKQLDDDRTPGVVRGSRFFQEKDLCSECLDALAEWMQGVKKNG